MWPGAPSMKSMMTDLALAGNIGSLGQSGPLFSDGELPYLIDAGRSLANRLVIAREPSEAVRPHRKSRRVVGVDRGREQMGDFIVIFLSRNGFHELR